MVLHDGRDCGVDTPHAMVVLDEPQRLRHIRATAHRLPFDSHFAVSGMRIFGHADGTPPKQTTPQAERIDELTVRLTWQPMDDAQGCNVRYGSAPHRLYRSWLVYGVDTIELRTLNAGQELWFCVDSFNASGVTLGDVQRLDEGSV